MITSGLAVTKSPADTEALPDLLASNFSLIVIGMQVPLFFLTVDCYSDD
jgi:hypothetical protein